MKIRNEYKKHIMGMLPELITFFVLLSIAFCVWDAVYLFVICPRQKEYPTLLQHDYSYIIESGFETSEYCSLKKLDNIITFKNSKGKKLNVNVYIQPENALAVCAHLKSGEVAVSRKMADILNIEVGSVLNAEYPIYDDSVEYRVVQIYGYMSNFYDVERNVDFSSAIVGDDGTLYKQAKGKMVYFLDDGETEQYADKGYSYSARYDLKTEKELYGGKNRLFSGIMVAAIFLMVVVCAYFSHRAIIQEVVKYYHDGYEIEVVKNINVRDHLIVLGIPTVVQELWMVLKLYNIGFLVIVSAVIVCTVIIASFVGGRKFDKSNYF